MSNVTKLYACFKAGFLGSNILDTYFSFVANIIIMVQSSKLIPLRESSQMKSTAVLM